MDDASRLAFVSQVLSLRDDFLDAYAGIWDHVSWRTDDEYAPVTFWMNCNDLFWWATADDEEITRENVESISEAVRDVSSALGTRNPSDRDWKPADWSAAFDAWKKVGGYAADLFCARSRKMRPQRPCYKRYPEALKPLFDACGPERDPKSEG